MPAGQVKEQRLNPDRRGLDTAVLVRRAQTGDQEAFGALYRRHVDRVHGLCLRLTADRDTAAQLTQDAFVRAWRNIAGFRGDSQLITWLHRLTVNVVLDHRRSERRRLDHQVNVTEADGLERLAVVHPAPVGMRQDLEQAIAGLPAGARAMFVLHEIEGYRLREIASVSGMIEVDAETGEVEIESVSGDIFVSNVSRRLSLSCVSGDVEIRSDILDDFDFNTVSGELELTARPAQGGRWEIDCHSGEVTLNLPSDVDAEFEIDTFSGDIDDDFGHKAERTSKYAPGKELSFTQGNGGARITVSVFSGEVRIVKQ